MLRERTVVPEELSDELVVERVKNGDLPLYEILMRRYNQRLFRVARSILSDADEAEDVMQEAYVRAYEHLRDFEGRSSFATWLTRIAVHEASARKKRRARFTSLEQDGTSRATGGSTAVTQAKDDPRERAAARELSSLIEDAVAALPPRYRSVFVLRETEGLSTQETADCLGLSEEAVKVRLHRARSVLRTSLEKRFGAATGEIFTFNLTRCDRVVANVFQRIRSR